MTQIRGLWHWTIANREISLRRQVKTSLGLFLFLSFATMNHVKLCQISIGLQLRGNGKCNGMIYFICSKGFKKLKLQEMFL